MPVPVPLRLVVAVLILMLPLAAASASSASRAISAGAAPAGAGGVADSPVPATATGSATASPAAKFAKPGRGRQPGAAAKLPKRFDQPDEALRFYLQKRLPEGETSLSPSRYLAAREQMTIMPRYSSQLGRFLTREEANRFAVGAWENLGPGNIGGRTRRLVIDPDVVTTMYAGAVAGGVWKTVDGAASWAPLDDFMANLAVASLAIDPNDTDTLYAGTGEGVFNFDAVRGAGIFATHDAGGTWTQLAATNNADFYYVNDLVVSPNSSARIYAATRTGVFRTLNGGTSWTKVIDGAAVNGCMDLAIKSDGPADTVFAACGTFAQGAIHRNVDAGGAGAWNAVFAEAGMGRTLLALAPSNENTIYALAASTVGGPGGAYTHALHAVFRSTTNGDSGTWTARVRNTDATIGNTLLLTNAPYSLCYGSNYNQGWYDSIIAVDPVDANIVWVGGVDLFRSNDGGANWGIASLWFGDSTDSMFAHADQHYLVFSPEYDGSSNKTLFVANDGGIFRTADARAAVDPITAAKICNTATSTIGVDWDELNNGYDVTQFYHGTVYPSGTTYYGGTQDNGTVRGTDAGGADAWATILGGDGGYTAVDPGNTNILFGEYTGFSIQKSINGGVSFSGATTGISGDDGGAFILPFQMDPGNAQRLWTGGWYIWRTINQAANWTRASAITTGSGSVSAVAAAPTNGDHVVVGMSDGFIHSNAAALTADSATVWPATQPRSGYVSHLEFDPQDANVAYATYSTFGGTHVWKTISGGASWSPLDGSGVRTLPNLPVHTITVDPDDSLRLYVGTDLGVFASLDGGATWVVENTSFAHTVVESLRLAELGADRYLYAFTHGRSAWRTLVVPGALFADGFESGNTAAWSSTAP